jgi:hypothetical protein
LQNLHDLLPLGDQTAGRLDGMGTLGLDMLTLLQSVGGGGQIVPTRSVLKATNALEGSQFKLDLLEVVMSLVGKLS